MPAVRFSPPQQWEDWCSWILGFWLCISPWALRFDLAPTATAVAVVTGILVILTELVTLTAFSVAEEWVNVVLGVWLIAAPWILGLSVRVATVNFVIVGVLLLALAAYEIGQGGPPGTEEA